MMKKLMLGAALSSLIVSGALAQTPAPNTMANPPASSATPATPPAAAMNKPAAAMNNNMSKPEVVISQKPDQWLASKFNGTDVIGIDNKKIGDVSDILFDKSGQIEAYVISVGGFLGVGAKDVALAPSAFEVVPGKNGDADKLKLSMDKQQLKQAENFTPYDRSKSSMSTTGSGADLGSGMHPPGSKQQ